MTLPAKKKPKKKKPRGRRTVVCSATGTTGTGKSTEIKKVATKLAKAGNNKVLVITYAGSGNSWNNCKEVVPDEKGLTWKTGWRKVVFVKHASKKFFVLLQIFQYVTNCILIFDDCKMYMSSDWESTKGLKLICNDHRHNGLDLFFIAHSPKHIPKQVWAYIKYSWVFKCGMKLKEDDLANENAALFVKAQNEVNARYSKELKKQKREPYGIFKYIQL